MSKKQSKKQLKQEKTLVFNKTNALAFANMIYSDCGGEVRFLKLCDGTLSNGKDDGRTLHCAVGEAYYQFVSKDMRQVLEAKKEEFEDGSFEEYTSKYDNVSSEGNTAAAIDELVAAAQLKRPTLQNKKKLAVALDDCVGANDGASGNSNDERDLATYCARSKQVRETWMKRVVPLLK